MFKENMFDNSSNNGERRPRPRFHREGESVSPRPRFRREERPAFGERSERSERPYNSERPSRPFNSERPNRSFSGERSERPQRPNRPFGGKPKRNNGLYSNRKQQMYHEEHIDP